MPSTETQTAAIVGMLAAATGTQPTVEHAGDYVYIEALTPEDLSDTSRSAVLRALSSADRYGHIRKDGQAVVWAEIDGGVKR